MFRRLLWFCQKLASGTLDWRIYGREEKIKVSFFLCFVMSFFSPCPTHWCSLYYVTFSLLTHQLTSIFTNCLLLSTVTPPPPRFASCVCLIHFLLLNHWSHKSPLFTSVCRLFPFLQHHVLLCHPIFHPFFPLLPFGSPVPLSHRV